MRVCFDNSFIWILLLERSDIYSKKAMTDLFVKQRIPTSNLCGCKRKEIELKFFYGLKFARFTFFNNNLCLLRIFAAWLLGFACLY